MSTIVRSTPKGRAIRQYFYLIHARIPNSVLLAVPVFVLASKIEIARIHALALLRLFEKHFEIPFRPSDPRLVMNGVNDHTLGLLMAELKSHPTVTVNLPHRTRLRLRQSSSGPPLSALQARVVGEGSHSPYYSL
jgi:hypothetical protein